MIIAEVRGDIFSENIKHVVFSVNTQGINDSGFAGLVSRRFWPELTYVGPVALGTVLRREVGNYVFHALAAHSLDRGGWSSTPGLVRDLLDRLGIPEGEPTGVVLIGGGLVGRLMGADVAAIHDAIDAAALPVTLFSL